MGVGRGKILGGAKDRGSEGVIETVSCKLA